MMKVKRKKITIKQRGEALAKANAAKAELTWATLLGLPVMQRAQRYRAAYWRHFNMNRKTADGFLPARI